MGPLDVTRTGLRLVLLLGILFFHVGPVAAQGLADDAEGLGAAGASGPPAWAYAMAHQMMSPFCPGRTLAACPSPQADQLRQWILFQAAAGQTEDRVEEMLLERFGDVLLSSPKAEGGWGISAYVIPVAGFLVGGAIVALVIFRLARRDVTPVPSVTEPLARAGQPAATPALSDAELERMVDEEFARS